MKMEKKDISTEEFPKSTGAKSGAFFRKVSVAKLSVLAIMSLATVVSVNLAQKKTQLNSAAAGEAVQVTFESTGATMPPNRTVTVVTNSGTHPLSLGRVDVLFDQTRVNLAGEIILNDRLKTQVVVTSMAEANSTGRATIVLGLSTADRANPPTGRLQFAQIPFTAVGTGNNLPATLTIDTVKAQFVDIQTETELTVGVTPFTFTLNPVSATNTPTPTSGRVTSTPTPRLTNTPTPRPSNTPTPRLTNTPTPRPSNTPTPRLTNTPTPRPSNTPTPRPSNTPTPRPSNTPVPTIPGGGTGSSGGIINLAIGSIGDDVNEDGQYFGAAGSMIWLGTGESVSGSYLGLRFSGVNISQGTRISGAKIRLYIPTTAWITSNVVIAADNTGNSPMFSSSSRPSMRTLTNAKVSYNANSRWDGGRWYELVDISPVIQEVVNRSDWRSGNSISIIIKGNGGQWGRKYVAAFDRGVETAPQLQIVTGSSGGGTWPTITPIATLRPTLSPTLIATVRPTFRPTAIPTVGPIIHPMDVDRSGCINMTDVRILMANYGSTNTQYDFDQSGRVDFGDIWAIMAQMGRGC